MARTKARGSEPIGYRWHLRMKMAEAGMFATSDLLPLLGTRGWCSAASRSTGWSPASPNG